MGSRSASHQTGQGEVAMVSKSPSKRNHRKLVKATIGEGPLGNIREQTTNGPKQLIFKLEVLPTNSPPHPWSTNCHFSPNKHNINQTWQISGTQSYRNLPSWFFLICGLWHFLLVRMVMCIYKSLLPDFLVYHKLWIAMAHFSLPTGLVTNE